MRSILERVPKLVTAPVQHDLLMLSLNPSFPTNPDNGILGWYQEQGFNYPESFIFQTSGFQNGFDEQLAQRHANLHNEARTRYPRFFQRPNELANRLGYNYAHLDLFLALTSKLPRDAQLTRNHRFTDLNPNFWQHQLDIAFELCTQIRPRVIVAVYASAADIFRRYLITRLNANIPYFGNTEYSRLRSLSWKFPWSNQKTLILRCSDLAGSRRPMSDAAFNQMANVLTEIVQQHLNDG